MTANVDDFRLLLKSLYKGYLSAWFFSHEEINLLLLYHLFDSSVFFFNFQSGIFVGYELTVIVFFDEWLREKEEEITKLVNSFAVFIFLAFFDATMQLRATWILHFEAMVNPFSSFLPYALHLLFEAFPFDKKAKFLCFLIVDLLRINNRLDRSKLLNGISRK